uniref:General transcription factor IIF subunit 2 n=1 Tax=Monodelphis domestica TaxID=13616 RepID=F7FIQ6_MONDO
MAKRGELDLTGAKQNTRVWLVKVPKYLSQQWTKASGRGEVGKLRIAKNQGRTEVSFTLNEELANICDIDGKPSSVSAPREHRFHLQSVGGQTLTVFTEKSRNNQLSLEGIVVQRAECRPAASENYMRLKRLQIEESSKPVRLAQHLDKAVTTNFKPVFCIESNLSEILYNLINNFNSKLIISHKYISESFMIFQNHIYQSLNFIRIKNTIKLWGQTFPFFLTTEIVLKFKRFKNSCFFLNLSNTVSDLSVPHFPE